MHAIVHTRSVRAKLRLKILPRIVIALTCSSSADNKAADCEIKLNRARAGFDHLIQPKGAVSPREFHANEFIAWLHVFSFMLTCPIGWIITANDFISESTRNNFWRFCFYQFKINKKYLIREIITIVIVTNTGDFTNIIKWVRILIVCKFVFYIVIC